MTRIVVVLAALVGSGPAFGADLDGIPAGSRVRLSSPTLASGAVIGTLVAVEAQAVVLTPRLGNEPLRVALDTDTKLELSIARRSQWARGAMVGAAIGAVPGLLLTFGDYSSDVHGDGPSPAAVAAMGAVGGALVGAAVGWAIKRDEWREVNMPNAGIGFIPWRGGVAGSVHVSWGAHRGRSRMKLGPPNKGYLDSSSQAKRVGVSSWRSRVAWLLWASGSGEGRTANVSAASSSERAERSRP